MKKILFLYKHDTSFVHNDIKILSDHYDVTPFFFKLSISCILRLFKELRKTDLVFIWFASYHAFIATLLTDKPKIIVTGGYDVANEVDPDIRFKFGLMTNPIYKAMVRYTLKKAHRILSVSETNKRELIENLGITRSTIVYNGVDQDLFKPDNVSKLNNVVLTVGFVNKTNWIRKGIYRFVLLAQYSADLHDDLNYYVVGGISEDMQQEVEEIQKNTPNITFVGYVIEKELIAYFQMAKVYCQLSHHEAFGCSVVEAMLCECIPVVSNRGALSEIIGDTGKVVIHDTEMIHKAVMEAKHMDGSKARERAIENFSLDQRENDLLIAMGWFDGN